ncbi:MAG: hypothetical protein HYV77_02520 [Candidatus Wildermuthbacteria bacterium]|nr:hypothetical protein [Candidatus Wildermuthbacteria bacterium]
MTTPLVVGLIGPTDIEATGRHLEVPPEFLLEHAQKVGRAIAAVTRRYSIELWFNSDRGMLLEVARAFKEAIRGDTTRGKLVMIAPRNPYPWPADHAWDYIGEADEVEWVSDWFQANYQVVSRPRVCVVVGLSGGTGTEIGYAGWDARFGTGNLELLVVIRELVRGGNLPPELVERIPTSMLLYAGAEEVERILLEFCARGSP